MVDHEVDGGRREGTDSLGRESEANEVHGAELALLLVGVAGLELAGNRELLADLDPHRRPHVDAHEAVEDGLDLVLLGGRGDKEGTRLSRPGQERVVDVELVLHAAIVGDPLHAAHLLDLEEQSVAVLEDEGQVAANGDPPAGIGLPGAGKVR